MLPEDISDHRQAEETLRLTQYAIDNCSVAIYWLHSDGSVFYTNEAARRHLGYSVEEMLSLSVSDIDPDWPADYWPIGWQELKQTGIRTFESRHRRKDGHVFPVEITTNYMQHGGEEYLFSFVTDITKRKQAERKLRDSETRLQAIFDHHYQLTGLLDREGRLLAANTTALEFAGTDESEVIGRFFWESPWWDSSQHAAVRQAIERAAQGEFVRFECTHIRADGEIRDVDFSLSPVRNEEGSVIYLVPEGRDITEMKRVEQRVREHEARLAHVARLSTMGEMTAGIAHEVSQPLQAIVNIARATRNVLQVEGEPSLSDLREWNAAMAESAERAVDVVRRMRSFARRGGSDRSTCCINEIARESVQLVAFEARRCGAAIHLELPEPSPLVDAGRVEIQQVLVNLLRNAFEAMDESESETRDLTIRVEATGESVRVSVADTGPGLAALDGRDIFEPFATSKESGLGLGLAISTSIIKAHGGDLRAESTADGGATFHFTLPALQGKANRGG